jgi:hypothetical protein
MWYGFWDADQDDDAAFDRRLSAVLREVGDRGKLVLSEAVPPFHEPTPAPAPALLPARSPAPAAIRAPAPAPAPTPAPAPVSTPALAPAATMQAPSTPPPAALLARQDTVSFTPSMQLQPVSPAVVHPQSGAIASLSEMSAFMEKQQLLLIEREVHAEAKATELRAEMDAKLEAQKQEMEQKLEQAQSEMGRLREAVVESRVREAEARARSEVRAAIDARSNADMVSEEQLGVFQTRIQALHASQLLSEDELYSLEDVVADCIEHGGPGASTPAAGQVTRMVALSEKMAVDGSLARQLRLKFA